MRTHTFDLLSLKPGHARLLYHDVCDMFGVNIEPTMLN